MTNYNDGKWHGWNGGECPVHQETVVDLTIWTESYGSGSGLDGCTNIKAGSITWNYVNSFRVIKEHKEPREWWSVGSVNYPTIELANNALDAAKSRGAFAEKIIHVREVIEE